MTPDEALHQAVKGAVEIGAPEFRRLDVVNEMIGLLRKQTDAIDQANSIGVIRGLLLGNPKTAAIVLEQLESS